MNIGRRITLLTLGVALMSCTKIFAQLPGVLMAESVNGQYSFIVSGSPWLTSTSPTGLLKFKGEKFSFAEASYRYENGGVMNYFGATSVSDFLAESRSIYRLSDRVVLSGGISYNNFSGEDMSGSVWINPYTRPFDILDFNGDNAGRKKLEMYEIDGAIAYSLTDNFSFGAGVLFQSANYAKMKDLRYKTSYSDLDVTLALGYSLLKKFDLALSYTFSQEVEGILFSTYGTGDKIYNELVSFGGFWGISSTYSEISHNIVKKTRQPYIDLSHKLSVGASAQLLSNLLLYVEGGYFLSSGSYGLDTPTSVVHTVNENSGYNLGATLLYTGSRSRHNLQGSYNSFNMINYQNIWSEVSVSGGFSEVIYGTPREVGDNTQSTLNISYRGDFKVDELGSKWQSEANFTRYSRSTVAQQYPFYRLTKLTSTNLALSGRYNLDMGLSFALGASYNYGGSTKYYDGTYVTPSSQMTEPRTSDEMLEREWNYLTSSRFALSPTIGYSLSIIYMELNYTYDKYIHADEKRHTVGFSIGCNF